MDTTSVITTCLTRYTHHSYCKIVSRGNAAITAALSILPKRNTLLIPAEGGWLSYRTIPKKAGLAVVEVGCHEAKIDIDDLKKKLSSNTVSAFLYQNPGGYFADQPMKEIYSLCQQHDCLVIMDVSGSIGTLLCDGRDADILVGSFGEWKLVDAKTGGFISCQDEKIWEKISKNVTPLADEPSLTVILQKLRELPARIAFLEKIRKKVIQDLAGYGLVHSDNHGFVVVIKFNADEEKEKIINYCLQQQLEWTECPRYIRLNKPAISIEIKRKSEHHHCN